MKKTTSLERAIQNLSLFTNSTQSTIANHVVDLAIREGVLIPATNSTLKKTFDRIGYLISSVFSSTARSEYAEKANQVRKILEQDVKTVRENTHLIAELQKGSPEDRQLAHSALIAIRQYNSILDSAVSDPYSWSAQLTRFIHEQTETPTTKTLDKYIIALPPVSLEQQNENECGINANDRSIQAFQSQLAVQSLFQKKLVPSSVQKCVSDDPFLVVELDLLRAKGFSELHKMSKLQNSKHDVEEILQAIHDRNAPLFVEFNELSSISTLKLSVTLPSNQPIEINASFKRHPASKGQSKSRSQLQTFQLKSDDLQVIHK